MKKDKKMKKLTKEELEVKIEYKNNLEKIELLTLFYQGGDLSIEVNKIDDNIIDPIKIYGYLKMYLKKLEYQLLDDEDE